MKKPYVPALIILGVVIILLIVWKAVGHSQTPAAIAPAPVSQTSSAETATSTASGTSTLPVYTLADVAEHSTESDCWLAIDGNVYNVTSFIPIHPGGKAILNGCGKDASVLFHSVPAHAEHDAEQTVAPKYLIGMLASTSSAQ